MGYGARRYLIVVSIGISLMISDAKHFFPPQVLVGYLYVYFGEASIWPFYSIFDWVFVLFVELYEFL